MKRLIFHPDAQAEAESAAAEYDSRRAGLGGDFLRELERVTDLLLQHPEIGGVYPRDTLRHFSLRRFPYVIVYAPIEDTIWVAAVAHGSREPLYWKVRKPLES